MSLLRLSAKPLSLYVYFVSLPPYNTLYAKGTLDASLRLKMRFLALFEGF